MPGADANTPSATAGPATAATPSAAAARARPAQADWLFSIRSNDALTAFRSFSMPARRIASSCPSISSGSLPTAVSSI